MENANHREQGEALPNFARCHEQDVSNQHVFDFFVTLSRATEQQNSSRSRNHVSNADHCFLRNLTRPFSRYRENPGAGECESESDTERCPALEIDVQQD